MESHGKESTVQRHYQFAFLYSRQAPYPYKKLLKTTRDGLQGKKIIEEEGSALSKRYQLKRKYS